MVSLAIYHFIDILFMPKMKCLILFTEVSIVVGKYSQLFNFNHNVWHNNYELTSKGSRNIVNDSESDSDS